MDKNQPNISNSEFDVMQIIWEKGPINSKDIIKHLSARKDWNEKTIKTLINRLLKKDAISFEKEGRTYLYSPLIKKEEYLQRESNTFLEKFYNDSLNSMFSYFIKDKKLSKSDIEQLKELLEEKIKDE